MENGRSRVVIERVRPAVEDGRFPAKRIAGEVLTVEADIFTDGHDAIAARLLWRKVGEPSWREETLVPLPNDLWRGHFPLVETGTYEFTVTAWIDHYLTWQRDLQKRLDAGSASPIDYLIGKELEHHASRQTSTTYDRVLRVIADPVKARFSTWYEFFPRSASAVPERHGTFRDCLNWLPFVKEMGFDVLYLPPIHPIGTAFRKGKNNSVTAEPGDVGSPWAIGSAEGGHTAVHPELGTLADFDLLVAEAQKLGIDIALDIAFQVSPDHPWVAEHPEWFRKRPDGTIQYAENPPKKYQDIYPFDFETSAYRELWAALKGIFEFWIGHGVSLFRVDNPHTKAFPFWEWCLGELKAAHPDLIFLSEAFTRPKIMYRLAKVGFTQSYTYFPWRHTKRDIEEYFTQLAQSDVREFFRPNHWPNTPDILPEFLQTSGRVGTIQRIILAATLGANYGIYGPPLQVVEVTPLRAGAEEYLHSEKYQLRHWDPNAPGTLRPLISQINAIRHNNEGLQNDWSLRFHTTDNDNLICYSKRSLDGTNLLVVVVNLDPRHRHSGHVELPLADLQIDPAHSYRMDELLSGEQFLWNGARNYVEIDPQVMPAQIFRVQRRVRTEREFEYFL